MKRKHIDAQRIDFPVNMSLKKIHSDNFRIEGLPPPLESKYIVVPKSGLKRQVYNIGSMISDAIPIFPEEYTDFETIVVEDTNSIDQIKEAVYEDMRLKVIPFEIFVNLPITWREYISWKLISENLPSGFESIIIQKEEKLDIKKEDLEIFRIITNPKSMYNYLDSVYPERTRREFDFLRGGVYRLAKVVKNPKIFDWIFENIKNKNLKVVRVLYKLECYPIIFKKEKAVLAYNMIPEFFNIMIKLDEKLNKLKIEHHIYSNSTFSFATITKGFSE